MDIPAFAYQHIPNVEGDGYGIKTHISCKQPTGYDKSGYKWVEFIFESTDRKTIETIPTKTVYFCHCSNHRESKIKYTITSDSRKVSFDCSVILRKQDQANKKY